MRPRSDRPSSGRPVATRNPENKNPARTLPWKDSFGDLSATVRTPITWTVQTTFFLTDPTTIP